MPMTYWLYPANTKYYDVSGAMAGKETFWPMHTKVELGDTLLIYLSAPYKQIGFVCEVIGIRIDAAKAMPSVLPFLKDKPNTEKSAKPFMQLRPAAAIPIDRKGPLELSHLKQHGLTGMLMGPRKLDNQPRLLEYILRNLP